MTDSASQIASDDAPNGPTAPQQQVVGADGRVSVPRDVTPATNAQEPATTDNGGGDTGVNSETRTTEETQATYYENDGSASMGPVPSPGTDIFAPSARIQSGTGTNDDSANNSATTTAAAVNVAFNDNQPITPQPNVLDNFYSYTYTASVYLMTPTQYERLLRSKKKTISGYQLLFQTGGAPNNVGGAKGAPANDTSGQLFDTEAQATAAQAASGPDAGRNPFFPLDYYIDSVSLETVMAGKQTSAAHMTSSLKFTVVEPNGITLLDNLYKAVQDFIPKEGSGAINYTACAYLMVIRFYGYDQNGNLVKVGTVNPDGTSDSKSVVEKFIPFIIRKINWGVSNKLVSYEFDCAPIGLQIAGTTRRGTIPYDIELADSSIKGLLGNEVVYSTVAAPSTAPGASTTSSTKTDANQTDAETRRLAAANAAAAPKAPDKANSAPTNKKTVRQGLMGAMNDFQKDLVSRKIYQRADEYILEFANGAEDIANATIKPAGKVTNTKNTPMAQSANQNAASLDSDRVAAALDVRNFQITAGMQVLQAIDLAIRNSSYIYNQSLIKFNEDGTAEVNEQAAQKTVYWYQISMKAEQIGYDTLRNDYAYRITYTVSKLPLQNFNSKFFPLTKFKGIHKSYPYWFTGQNTSVLDFQQNFNTLYNITVSGTDPENQAAAKFRQRFASSMRELPYYTYDARSSQSPMGAEGKGEEVGANAAEYLYSPADMGRAKVRIIGDPAWIQQGSIATGVSAKDFSYSAFNPDGTINFDSNQVMFEIAWQRPEDYSLETGLADPYAKTKGTRNPIQSTVYQAVKVTSDFKQGRFEQNIEGTLYMFPKPDGKNKAPASAANGVNSAGQAIGLEVRDEDGTLSKLRKNPETGELYDPGDIYTKKAGGTVTQAAKVAGGAGTTVAPTFSSSGTSTAANGDIAEPAPEPQGAAEPASSNGETLGQPAFPAPPKIGETDAPQVGSPDLGDFFG